jgi:hypothetical protein
MSDEIREQEPWLDRLPVAASVHRYLDLDHGPPSDAAARAARTARSTELGDEVSEVAPRRVERVGRLELASGGGARVLRVDVEQGRPVDDGAHADREPSVPDDRSRHPERVVAAAQSELFEGDAGAGIGPLRRDDELVRLERGGEVGDEEFGGGDLALAPRRARTTDPRETASASGSSALASACAIEPQTVPRFRVAWCPM